MRHLIGFFWVVVFVLFLLGARNYPGQILVYVVFAITANLLLWCGFRNNASFFDAFIGVFFWLGFWLKLSVRVAFLDSQFHEPTGNFDGSGAAFDRALLAASCGFLGLIAATVLRERYLFASLDGIRHQAHTGLIGFYKRNRKAVLFGFVILVAAVTATNMWFGIYQRGMVPRTVPPFGLSGVYSWLLLFGLASISAVLLYCEYGDRKETTYAVPVLGVLESFLSNVSLLSRGMILNSSALAYGLLTYLRAERIRTSLRFWLVPGSVFVVLFAGSIALVNVLRMGESIELESLDRSIDRTSGMTKPLILDRWVGIEGMLAVSSSPKLGWGLLREAWNEKFTYGKTSFYDSNLIASPYDDMDVSRHHFVSLPGILAFCFYPGSFLFLFVCMVGVGLTASGIEASAFKLGGGNVILCALLAQVVAYRYAHFGYVPAQSYLLFGAIGLNLLLIVAANRFLISRENRSA